MNFLIISHVPHKKEKESYFAYAPYVREMNLWLKHVDKTVIVAPKVANKPSNIDLAYVAEDIQFCEIPTIQFTSLKSCFSSVFKLPIIFIAIFKACKKADHIHLRCPGNIGLLGCFVQIIFPKKTKTAKYAGNWDPNAKQPLSYRLQKRILSNTFLTKNMQVLVYGEWQNGTKNIKPFFTASYFNYEIEKPIIRDYSGHLKFMFVGSLVAGKRPLLAIQIAEALYKQGKSVHLDMYGDGILKEDLQYYIVENKLETMVRMHGNQSKEVIKEALKQAHFSILASKSEGWPKAIAEAMFFGVIPISTSVSCVPYMLDFGNRGILIEPDLNKALEVINHMLEDEITLRNMSNAASKWSQEYTLDVFESDISKLIHCL